MSDLRSDLWLCLRVGLTAHHSLSTRSIRRKNNVASIKVLFGEAVGIPDRCRQTTFQCHGGRPSYCL